MTFCLASYTLSAFAQALPTIPQSFTEDIRQQERDRALREQQEQGVDERLEKPAPQDNRRLPKSESPCFRIDRIILTGDDAEDFQWALAGIAGVRGDDDPRGRCLGTEGVNIVLARIQQAIIADGYVTTRVLAGSQDLTQGTLTFTLIPGRIAAIHLTPDSTPTTLGAGALLAATIPARAGDLLNLRAIEQGLENLKRIPGVAADIQIKPAAGADAVAGQSDLEVKYIQARAFRGAVNLDDSGMRSTGKTIGSVTLSADNLLGLADMLYINAGHGVGGDGLNSARGSTESQSLGYTIPYGNWVLGFNASNSRYWQSVPGLIQNYIYAGKNNYFETSLSRLIYRDQHSKTSVSARAFRREGRNYIDDAELDVQHRVVSGWILGINQKEFIDTSSGTATLDGNLNYKRGTGAFGSIPAPEENFGTGTSRMQLITADASLNIPIVMGEQRFRYSGLWRAQWNRTPLTTQDQFAIGGRYTVRGFDGETSLIAERGWFIRNDLGWSIPGVQSAELYLGADWGQVGGPSTVFLLGDHLAGAVAGVRGAWNGLNYDLFAGAPISKPENYPTASLTGGFSLTYSF